MAKISDIGMYLKASKDLRLNLAMVGAHGRAKTSVTRQYADSIGYELITKILASLEPTDMIGLPVVGDYIDGKTAVTKNSYPEWLVAACDPNRKVILFFDEFNNAEKDVQSSILNLIEDRRIDDMVLADTTQIIMAFNPPSIAPNGRRLAKATRDRLCVIPIEDDKDSFKKYYNENGMNAISRIIDECNPIPCYDEEVTEFAYENAEFTYRSIKHSYDIVNYCIDNNYPDKIGISLVSGYGGNNGHVVFKELKEKIQEDKDGDSFEAVVKQNDRKALVYFVNKNAYFENMLDFNKMISKVKFIEENYSEKDFDWVLNQIFSEEFINAYQSYKG